MKLSELNQADSLIGTETLVMNQDGVTVMGGLDDIVDFANANAFSGAYADLTGKPTLSTVASTGAFIDLVSKPTTLAGFGITDGVNTNQLGAASGVATLDSGGKITAGQLPSITISDTFVVASQAAMLALTADVGDVAVRTDVSKSFILKTAGAGTLVNWQELLSPTDAVQSVNGQTGVVTLDLFSGNYNDLTNKPTLFSGSFADLTSKPTTLAGYGITDASPLNFTQTGTGAAARSVDSKIREVVSAKDFGAVGDGITNDTAAIQAALNTNKKVFLPAGSYLISSPLSVTSGGLYGAGSKATQLICSACHAITIPANQDLGRYAAVISDFGIRSLTGSDCDDKYAFYIPGVASGAAAVYNSGITIERIDVGRVARMGGGFYLKDTFRCNIQNIGFTDVSWMIRVVGSNIQLKIRNVTSNNDSAGTALSRYGITTESATYSDIGVAGVENARFIDCAYIRGTQGVRHQIGSDVEIINFDCEADDIGAFINAPVVMKGGLLAPGSDAADWIGVQRGVNIADPDDATIFDGVDIKTLRTPGTPASSYGFDIGDGVSPVYGLVIRNCRIRGTANSMTDGIRGRILRDATIEDNFIRTSSIINNDINIAGNRLFVNRNRLPGGSIVVSDNGVATAYGRVTNNQCSTLSFTPTTPANWDLMFNENIVPTQLFPHMVVGTSTITGAASLNVLKAGDTMTGALTVRAANSATGFGLGEQFISINNTSATGLSTLQFQANGTAGASVGLVGGSNFVVSTGAGTQVERFRITTAGGFSVGDAGNAYGTAGQVLTSAGNAPPTWSSPASGAANTLTGTTLAPNVVTSSLTSLGTLTSLTLSGAITGATDLTTTGNTILGNAAADTLNVGNGGLIKDANSNVGINMSPASTVALEIKEADAGQDLIVGLSAGTGARAQLRSIAQADNTSSVVTISTTTAGSAAERLRIDATGQIIVQTASKGISIKEGSNCKMGIATLVTGSAVVSNTAVTSTSRILLTSQVDGGTPGWLRVSARTAGTSFTITSSSATDTSTVAYFIIEPS